MSKIDEMGNDEEDGLPEDEVSEWYQPYDKIEFWKAHHLFQSLVLFDDMFLNMQAMNIAIVDDFITECEYGLLREYIEIEKTPMDTAIFVSAQSQMWIFALYELLRTWRSRISSLIKWKDSGAIETMLKKVKEDELNLAALMRQRHLKQLRDDPEFETQLKADRDAVEPIFRMTEAIRINLAKHEVPKKGNLIPRAPGYGRINMGCGALDFEIQLSHDEFEFLNRRDIADSIRKLYSERQGS
jgi:hypothetical protein